MGDREDYYTKEKGEDNIKKEKQNKGSHSLRKKVQNKAKCYIN